MILLAFRLTKHYWRLAVRQLTLPVGLGGESFPYRSDFVDESIGSETHEEGLICGKFDVEDFPPGGNRSSVYVPLRLVRNVTPEFVPDSNVKYFNYTLGQSVDYRGQREWNHYSQGIRAAVFDAMGHRKDHLQVDSDKVLVIRIEYIFPDLNPEEETDRWIRLTRMITGSDVYRGTLGEEMIGSQFGSIAFGRVALVQEIGSTGRISSICSGRTVVRAGYEFSITFVTNVSPDLKQLKPFPYLLKASDAYFEVIDDIREVSQGILHHRFLARCRQVFSGRTHLRLQAGDVPGVYAPEVVLPIEVRMSMKLWPRILGGVLIMLGLVVGFVGILPDRDLAKLVNWSTRLSTVLDATRFWLRFAAITSASSGIGLWLFNQDRPR